MRIQHIGIDTQFIDGLMKGDEFEQARNKVVNTVKQYAIIQ